MLICVSHYCKIGLKHFSKQKKFKNYLGHANIDGVTKGDI